MLVLLAIVILIGVISIEMIDARGADAITSQGSAPLVVDLEDLPDGEYIIRCTLERVD